MKTLWVQSKYSKDARKFEVTESDSFFHYWQPPDRGFVLPKEEYIPCDPPDKWETCTREMVVIVDDGSIVENHAIFIVGNMHGFISGYRWAWSEKDPDALVIERRVP